MGGARQGGGGFSPKHFLLGMRFLRLYNRIEP